MKLAQIILLSALASLPMIGSQGDAKERDAKTTAEASFDKPFKACIVFSKYQTPTVSSLSATDKASQLYFKLSCSESGSLRGLLTLNSTFALKPYATYFIDKSPHEPITVMEHIPWNTRVRRNIIMGQSSFEDEIAFAENRAAMYEDYSPLKFQENQKEFDEQPKEEQITVSEKNKQYAALWVVVKLAEFNCPPTVEQLKEIFAK